MEDLTENDRYYRTNIHYELRKKLWTMSDRACRLYDRGYEGDLPEGNTARQRWKEIVVRGLSELVIEHDWTRTTYDQKEW